MGTPISAGELLTQPNIEINVYDLTAFPWFQILEKKIWTNLTLQGKTRYTLQKV